MDRISGLSDELLVKILCFLPTKEVVSTSTLSKRWEFLWMWVPKLKFETNHFRSDFPPPDFITKNLRLLKPQVIESFHLQCLDKLCQPEDIKHWVGTTISCCVRELIIIYCGTTCIGKPVVLLPSNLYTCTSLVTLKLAGSTIIVDVPRTVCLLSLKTLELDCVAYSNEDSLRLLLSYCPVLEDLTIHRNTNDENVKTLVVIVPSLLRLTLYMIKRVYYDGYVIVTPSLKYFKAPELYEEYCSYLFMHMPKLEEADLTVEHDVEGLFESITSVKRLELDVLLDIEDKLVYRNGIFFNQLEYLMLYISRDSWSKLLVQLLEDSSKLRVLKVSVDVSFFVDNLKALYSVVLLIFSFKKKKKKNLSHGWYDEEYEHVSWNNDDQIPKCLLDSLEDFEFTGYTGRPEERDFVSYIFKHACHLKSSSISRFYE